VTEIDGIGVGLRVSWVNRFYAIESDVVTVEISRYRNEKELVNHFGMSRCEKIRGVSGNGDSP
jgi:hypothetical protein